MRWQRSMVLTACVFCSLLGGGRAPQHRTLQLVWADDSTKASPADSETTRRVPSVPDPVRPPVLKVEDLLRRIDAVERELFRKKRRAKFVPARERHEQLLLLLEHPALGVSYTGSSRGTRYFAARLILLNRSKQPVVVHRGDVQLEADGKTFPLRAPSAPVGYTTLRIGGRNVSLRELRPSERLEVAPDRAAATWVVFSNLPPGNRVPKMKLSVRVGSRSVRIDVNEFCLGLLRLDIERLGPDDCLAVFTISGEMNLINLGALIDEIDRLQLQNVSRVVLYWPPETPPVDTALASWLQQSVRSSRRSTPLFSPFPTFPVIARVYLAGLSTRQGATSRSASPPARYEELARGRRRSFSRLSDAVTAALWDLYESIPRAELLRAIRRGPDLTRAAALAAAADRLPEDALPLVLRCTDDGEAVQRAALMALRYFRSARAIETLSRTACADDEALAEVAIESLAASRSPKGQQRLLELIQQGQIPLRPALVETLGHYPDSLWSDLLVRWVRKADDGVAAAALRTLVHIGHPRLETILREALESDRTNLSEAAFAELFRRRDPESQQILLQYTLRWIQTRPPTNAMYALLNQTKDNRAIPALLKHLEQVQLNRAALITTLSYLGDRSVAERLNAIYPRLQDQQERAAAIRALRRLRSPHFLERAREAIRSGHPTLVQAVCQEVQIDPDERIVQLLAEALQKIENRMAVSQICSTLASIATPSARQALQRAAKSDNAEKRNYAQNALRSLYTRSPANPFVSQGRRYSSLRDWKTAERYFTLAIQIDPELPQAYSGRGNCELLLNNLDQAKEDFRRALALDPGDGMSVAGLAIALVRLGQVDEGLQLVESSRKKFANDGLFAYNAACVYARALEQLKDETEKAKLLKKQYRDRAVADLKAAIAKGFNDFDWMKQDPDLRSLHGWPAFENLLRRP
ncbi:MAG: tetratricopeptide repeat protein [Planctomycetes bacterium]|nr:tetratricopeptide repeat protein [Planctomycetota bacterium]